MAAVSNNIQAAEAFPPDIRPRCERRLNRLRHTAMAQCRRLRTAMTFPGNAEIPKVPQQLPPECCPLVANRFMPMLPTPIRDALESRRKRSAAVFCFTTQYPLRDRPSSE